MVDEHVIAMLEKQLKSNDWMILAVGDLKQDFAHASFQIGQVIHNNQNAVTELAGYGYFPAGTVFVAKTRRQRRDDGKATLIYSEVGDNALARCDLERIRDRIDWHKLSGLLSGRIHRERRMAAYRALEKEMDRSRIGGSRSEHWLQMDGPFPISNWSRIAEIDLSFLP